MRVVLRELKRNEKYKKDYVKVTTILMLNDGLGFDLVSRYLEKNWFQCLKDNKI